TQSVTAAEVLSRMEMEAKPFTIGIGTSDCLPVKDLPSPTDLTDRIGRSLGVSGERVREAMRQALPPLRSQPAGAPVGVGISVAGPGRIAGEAGSLGPVDLPGDPIQSLATQLGVSQD